MTTKYFLSSSPVIREIFEKCKNDLMKKHGTVVCTICNLSLIVDEAVEHIIREHPIIKIEEK